MVRPLMFAAIVAGLCSVTAASGPDRQKHVLALYATRRDAQIAIVGDRELPRILEYDLAADVDYYSEFIDQSRFSSIDYQSAFRDFLRLKYAGKAFDLVVAMGDTPLEFLRAYRDLLFPDVPVVFFEARSSSPRLTNSTGITAPMNVTGTVEMAIALQPDTRRVFVVSGADPSDRTLENVARTQLRAFEPRLDVTYLSGLPTEELQARLQSLPEHSIVYYLIVERDGANQMFNALEYLDRLAARANAPIYCWVDSAMDHGIVGGSLKDQVVQAEAVGAFAVRVLNGERADSIPVSEADLNVKQVDWRQLRRWRISEARVPAGTRIRFRDPSIWDRYKVYILGAVAILLAQATLIAALLLQRSRRQQAETQLQASQARLRVSYDRIRNLGKRLLNAQESERSRIARELHDDISQQMAVLTIDLQLLSQTRAAGADDVGRLTMGALDHANAVSRSVHALSHRLHPENLRLLGLVSAINSLQRELSTPDVAVTFSHEQVPAALPHDLTLCLFRIAQESVRNAVAHSRAREVAIRLIGGPDTLVLTVTDNGVGFDVDAAHPGLGLISMSERAEQVGAELRIRSRRGSGTEVEVTVSLAALQTTSTAV
ncbi:MAG TPA: ABC transporter substrate binding protein [Vicinamibacterales bacterium]|nr:ABC transporter substrate binding protein [Vicinamibacterales bacterium]